VQILKEEAAEMKNNRNNSGMAIVIVLTLCTAILILGVSYIKSIRQQGGRNTIELGAVQADLLAEGITQIAMLKFKELPGPLYYACIAAGNGIASGPLNLYRSDAILNNSIAEPVNADFRTSFKMLPSKMYEDMNVKITIEVNVERPDGKNYQRIIERNVFGARRPAF
jgi:uncharacterized membrane protein